MMIVEKVIAAAKKRGKPGLYKDKSGNIWQVYRVAEKFAGATTWRAEIIYPWIVDEEEP